MNSKFCATKQMRDVPIYFLGKMCTTNCLPVWKLLEYTFPPKNPMDISVKGHIIRILNQSPAHMHDVTMELPIVVSCYQMGEDCRLNNYCKGRILSQKMDRRPVRDYHCGGFAPRRVLSNATTDKAP